jgi:hypothetical protein
MSEAGFLWLFCLSLYSASKRHKALIKNRLLRLAFVGFSGGRVYQQNEAVKGCP